MSANALALKIMESGLDFGSKKIVYNDLGYFFGLWTEDDYKNFKESTKSFSRVEKEIWL